MAKRKRGSNGAILPLSLIIFIGIATFNEEINTFIEDNFIKEEVQSFDKESIPEYFGESYVVLNDNTPYFTRDEYDIEVSFEKYSKQDILGRSRVAVANIGKDLMPTEERGSIGSIKPSGWQTVKYDFVDGKYLYNRCHLIGFQLTGENANEKNLITCTRSMNTGIMLQYENAIAKYIKKTGNHVLYRVTPVYDGVNLVARGVIMEAISIEDDGEGIKFNIFVYNVEEGVEIDYLTGDSRALSE